jgi:RNase P/RNase MRP subunit POP5
MNSMHFINSIKHNAPSKKYISFDVKYKKKIGQKNLMYLIKNLD